MTRRSFLLCLVYVPPNAETTYHAKLLSFLESLFSLGHCVIILGDFNLPDICWTSLSSSNPHSKNFCDFIVTNGLEQLITFPRGNILDLLLCDSPGLILNLHKLTLFEPLPNLSLMFQLNLTKENPALGLMLLKRRF